MFRALGAALKAGLAAEPQLDRLGPQGTRFAALRRMGGRRWTTLVLAAMALATAGCAAYAWQRPGTPAAVTEQDIRECDDLAQRLAMDLDIRALADRDWPGGWRRSPYWGFPDPGGSLAFKQRTAQRCMEAKGYRLVKQPP